MTTFSSAQRKPAGMALNIAQPFSLQAEQAIIGALIGDPVETSYQVSDKLAGDHFYDPFCRLVYQKAIELINESHSLDVVVLASKLDGFMDMNEQEIRNQLERIYNTYPSVNNLEGWADVIIDKHVERILAHTGESLKQMAHAQNVSRDEKLSKAQNLLADVGSTMSSDTIVDATQMIASTIELIEKFSAAGGKITGVPTGFTKLDEVTSGLGAGDLVIVGARPSMGKTAFALSLAKHVCSELPKGERQGVLLFSMEMGVTQIGLRWLAARHGISMKHMRSGRITPQEHKTMMDALAEASEVPFFLEESGCLNVEQLAAKARRKHREHPIGMIVIDYLQLISDTSGRNNSSKAERVGDISRALKQLARELKIPVVALSQLSRDLEKRPDKRPIMSDLRESGAIEQDADVIMFVYRDEVYNANTLDRGIGEIIIAKQRNGPLDVVRLVYDAPTTCFKNP